MGETMSHDCLFTINLREFTLNLLLNVYQNNGNLNISEPSYYFPMDYRNGDVVNGTINGILQDGADIVPGVYSSFFREFHTRISRNSPNNTWHTLILQKRNGNQYW